MPHLNIAHRAQIYLGIRTGKTDAEIARGIGFHRGTVGREIERNGGRENYDLWKAQRARDFRQGMAVGDRMLFGGGVPFDSRLRKLNLKYAYLSHLHIHWYDYYQDRFFRKAEAWRYRRYVSGKAGTLPLVEPQGRNLAATDGFVVENTGREDGMYIRYLSEKIIQYALPLPVIYVRACPAHSRFRFQVDRLESLLRGRVLLRIYHFLRQTRTGLALSLYFFS
ncbi:hypothetical protein FUAX_43510 (plasmid) [Fulvitalea axinellae]|uniref:Transposase IS30-like HTH domain-containing protein n=1 Tax=Fulvitalea axinellae TaxID=1182444 RepID=A0AAU9CZI0_9BACT|nr:hypothetical protein FUAX_43510 [Fulvitalea axinellae]